MTDAIETVRRLVEALAFWGRHGIPSETTSAAMKDACTLLAQMQREAKAAQEPVAWLEDAAWGRTLYLTRPDYGKAKWKAPEPRLTPLYTHPTEASRPSLTGEQIRKLLTPLFIQQDQPSIHWPDIFKEVRAIEAAHGITDAGKEEV